MSTSTILPPVRRSTRAELAVAEQHQTAVIARLRTMGADRLADRLARCQQARLDRQPGSWPWRCRSAGCHWCRRATVRRWWRGFLKWLGSDHDVSLVTIEFIVTTDVLAGVRRMRKGLRDVRDRAARNDPAWAEMAMAGLLNGDAMLLVIQHAGIERDKLWTTLERRWPEVVVTGLTTATAVTPHSELSVQHTVELAVLHRGIEPIRIVVPAQLGASATADEWDKPMPVVI